MDSEYIYSRYSRSQREAKHQGPSLAERIWAEELREKAEQHTTPGVPTQGKEINRD